MYQHWDSIGSIISIQFNFSVINLSAAALVKQAFDISATSPIWGKQMLGNWRCWWVDLKRIVNLTKTRGLICGIPYPWLQTFIYPYSIYYQGHVRCLTCSRIGEICSKVSIVVLGWPHVLLVVGTGGRCTREGAPTRTEYATCGLNCSWPWRSSGNWDCTLPST